MTAIIYYRDGGHSVVESEKIELKSDEYEPNLEAWKWNGNDWDIEPVDLQTAVKIEIFL